MTRDLIAEFLSAMRDQGFNCPDQIVADGKIHRFAYGGDSNPNGWYLLHLDSPPSGAFGDWKSGLKGSWTAHGGKAMTDEERDVLKKRMAADKKRKQREEEAIKYEAKLKASAIWSESKPSDDEYPYLKKKKVLAHGSRIFEGQLTIPVRSGGELVGLQFIPADGKEKRFLSGTPVTGAYTTIGVLPEKDITVVICEGFATAASIFEATAIPVLAAFNAGNLVPVAKAFRAQFPDAKIIIAADNDQWTTKPINNPGTHYAHIAGIAAQAFAVRIPIFPDGFKGKPTDFNDLAETVSKDEVKHQIETGKSTWISITRTRELQIAFEDDVFRDRLPHHEWDKNPLGTILNLDSVLSRVGAIVRYNVIAKKQEILIQGRSYSLDNYENATFADILDACVRFKMPTGNLVAYLTKLADLNQYNPVKNWIESKEWDGVNRLDKLYSTVKAKNEELDPSIRILKEILIRRWMLSAIAAAYRPNGVAARGVLVFQGLQYLGKTKWFMSLVPPELGLAAEGLTLKTDDKDSVYQLLQYWIVELGELDSTFRKSDIAQLKSFIPKSKDTIRLPFMPKSSTFPRRTVMFGSVNPEHYLNDPTGNTRFWTIACESINYDHGIDMQQAWAELLLKYNAGDTWYLTADEMDELNRHNDDFTTKEPVEERIAGFYDWTRKDGTWKTATQILEETGIERPTRQELIAASVVIKTLNGGQTKKNDSKRLLWVPNKGQFVNPVLNGFQDPP